ncbi:hypothetical protein V491_05272, partial [Pseudogymnoascus sp. VKM F-3775]
MRRLEERKDHDHCAEKAAADNGVAGRSASEGRGWCG